MTGNRRYWAIVVLGVALFFAGALDWGYDRLLYPWVLAQPPLLGSWVGTPTSGNGVPMVVGIDMARVRFERDEPCWRCHQIEGTAATCDARGTVLRYRLSGSPADRQGRQLHLGAVPARQPLPDGLELDILRGTWHGAGELSLDAGFFWRRDGSGISTTDDPATQPVPMRRQRKSTADFNTLCKALARRAQARAAAPLY